MTQETQTAVLTPKFLTEDMARFAVKCVVGWVFGRNDCFPLKRLMCHVIVLVPAMKDDRAGDCPDYPNYELLAHVLCEESFGKDEGDGWPHRFDDIARCKALQLWHGRNDGRTDIVSHLVFPGDTPYWGGVKREGIVVACSGVQPWFDRMISGMIADVLIALSHDERLREMENLEGVDFLE